MPEALSAAFPYEKRRVSVLESEMAYVDVGESTGATVVFLHGNPTSSYLWRNVIPHVSPQARCIAPDLMGMGDSGKLPASAYGYAEHARYLEAFLNAVAPEGKLVFVVHDWGSGLGLDWCRRHADRVAGIALMEFIFPFPTWEEFPEEARDLFKAYRSPDTGRKMLIEENQFIEQVLPNGIVRPMTDAEMNVYRKPFLKPEDREPVYRFPNDFPIAGEPAGVFQTAETYHAWLLASTLPKLYFWASPGGLILEPKAKWYSENLRNTRSVHLGPGRHFVQEDNPHLIGREVAAWLPELSMR